MADPTGLTKREREIAELIAQGLPTHEIARRLFVHDQTVKYHLTNLYRKYGVTTRVQFALAWVKTDHHPTTQNAPTVLHLASIDPPLSALQIARALDRPLLEIYFEFWEAYQALSDEARPTAARRWKAAWNTPHTPNNTHIT
jgi:DNA-binding CsgD family transcriptional regulator